MTAEGVAPIGDQGVSMDHELDPAIAELGDEGSSRREFIKKAGVVAGLPPNRSVKFALVAASRK